MRINYFNKLINYMKNVYHIDQGIKKLSDGRITPKYPTGLVVGVVLFGFLLRVKSFNELNLMIKSGEFRNLFPRGAKLPGIDTIRDTLKVLDMEVLKSMLTHTIAKACENKVFTNGTIDGYTIAAIDGTKFFGSNKKSCPECLTSQQHHFHSGVVMSMIGDGPKLVLGFEMYRPGIDSASKNEGEQNAAKRLLSSVLETHRNQIDVVVYDALACNSVWINHCLDLGVDVIVRAKNQKNSSIWEIKRRTNKQAPIAVWDQEKGFERVDVFESTFMMENVNQPLRFVKFVMKHPDKKRSQIMIVTSSMDMDHRSLFRIIRARWDIENCIFNNLKRECGLEHCYVHGGKAVEVVLTLIFIASNIIQLFYYRRIKKSISTQRELIRLLIKGLYILKHRCELAVNSS